MTTPRPKGFPKVGAQPQTHRVYTLPAPALGLDTVSPLAEMNPLCAVQMDNVLSTDGGCRVRSGWREFAINIPGDTIKTVFSWSGAPLNAVSPPFASSKLFAATDIGIFDITAGGDFAGATPDVDLFDILNAGRLSKVMFNTGFSNYLVVCSEIGGAWLYDGTTWTKFTQNATPTQPGQISGVNPDDFTFVMAWKERLWFIRSNSTEAWYLPVQSAGGEGEYVDFGPSFTTGGQLLALVSWTQDAGKGLDDHLVVLSSAGDMAIFQGTDPSFVDQFGMVGSWYVGQPPIGRRFFTETGGMAYVLTDKGMLAVGAIVQGGIQTMETAQSPQIQGLRRIQNALRNDFNTLLSTIGWEVFSVREQILISRPQTSVAGYSQYLFMNNTNAWSILRDIPAVTWGFWLNEVYGGTDDGRVLHIFTGNTDGVEMDGSGGTEIRSRVAPAFSYLGDPADIKHAVMAKAQFLAVAPPAYEIYMLADYEVFGISSSPIGTEGNTPLWDDAIWDQSLWAGGLTAFADWRSVGALGRSLAPSVYLASSNRTLLISVSLMFKTGGVL